MSSKVFFDSNIVLYALSADPNKAAIAKALLRTKGTVSVQVLNEVTHITQRKMHYSWSQTHSAITALQGMCEVTPLTVATHDHGRRIAERYQLSVYDGMIAAAALLAGCSTLYSEDIQNGLVIDGTLTINNPLA